MPAVIVFMVIAFPILLPGKRPGGRASFATCSLGRASKIVETLFVFLVYRAVTAVPESDTLSGTAVAFVEIVNLGRPTRCRNWLELHSDRCKMRLAPD